MGSGASTPQNEKTGNFEFETPSISYAPEAEGYVEPDESDIPASWDKVIESKVLSDVTWKSWDHDVFKLNTSGIFHLSGAILSKIGATEKYKIDTQKWARLCAAVYGLMSKHGNSYHNFSHVADVMQTAFVIVSEYGLNEFLNEEEQFALIFGSFIHDLDHPGISNPYLINSGHPLATLYNESSILENYHVAKAMTVIGSDPKLNVFSDMSREVKSLVRKKMIMGVLATDMTFHFSMKADLDSLTARKKEAFRSKTPFTLTEKDRDLVLKAALHASDISNPCKPWETCKAWSDRVITEFFDQGDREKREGLPVSMSCDRDTTHQDELSMNFSDFIVAPFFFSLINFLPKMFPVGETLISNRQSWYDMYLARMEKDSLSDEPDSEASEKRKTSMANFAKRAQGFATSSSAAIADAKEQLALAAAE